MSDNHYPDHLVPKSYYLNLKAEPFKQTGYVVRCLDKPADVDPTGMLSEKSFSFPQTDSLVRHLSVSLLGNYKLNDAAWQFSIHKDSPRYKEFDTPWFPKQDGLYPTSNDATHPEDGKWGYFWIPLIKLHGEDFLVGSDTYTCYVVHKPTCRNYWHFELHFKNEKGEDIDELFKNELIKRNKIRGISTGIRAKLLTVSKTYNLDTKDWPKFLYQKKNFWQYITSFFALFNRKSI